MPTPAPSLSVEVRQPCGTPLAVSGVRLLDSRGAVATVAPLVNRDVGALTLMLGQLAPGDYRLELELGGRPTLGFCVELRAGEDRPRLEFRGPPPACCELDGERLRVTLAAEHQEIIFIAGWDYSGGSNNNLWCETWRDDLYAGVTWLTGDPTPVDKLIYDHTIVTQFDFASGHRIRRIKGREDWHEIDRVLQGSVPTHLGDYKDAGNREQRQRDDSISITDVYDYIAELGRRSPGSLLGFHIFSHAWTGGPVLVNTREAPEYARAPERDPADKDGRTKDFTPIAMPNFDHFRRAFGPGAIAKIWGCFATQAYRRMVRQAAKAGLDQLRKLEIRWDEDTVVERTAEEIGKYFRTDILVNSYMGQLGRAAEIPVYGAPPGMGANYKRVNQRFYMFVRQAAYDLEYEWFAEALDLEPDVSGHIPYYMPKSRR